MSDAATPAGVGGSDPSTQSSAHPPVEVAFFGGLGEIGANMASITVDGKIALIDTGLTFPDAEHFGIDLILPDWSRLREHSDDVICVVLTHGHEDHIGALPFFLREFPNVVVFASRLTVGFAEAKLSEHPDLSADLRVVDAGERVSFDPFEIEFIGVTHSIPDGFSVAFHTPHGTVLHSGDFKLDQTPIDGKPTDLPHLAQLGDEGVALLLADSTNADVAGHTASERNVGRTLHDVFSDATGRIVVTTFASHVHRVQQVMDAAVSLDRKVCLVGRSMVRNMPIARELGYLTYDDRLIVDMAELESLPREQTVILCTGSQGEPYAALSLMAVGQHRQVSITEGDTVVLASSVIPGNESAIYRAINGLARHGANVVHKGIADVHVSGHAAADELKFFHNIVRARAFVPVHGEYRHLLAHSRLAQETGTPAEQVFVCTDGDTVILRDGVVQRGEPFTAGRVFVDGLGVGDVGNAVLRERGRLSEEGICVAVVQTDQQGRIVEDPEVFQHGVVYEPDSPDLMAEAVKVLREELGRIDGDFDPAIVRRTTSSALGRFWKDRTGRRPIILPIVVEV